MDLFGGDVSVFPLTSWFFCVKSEELRNEHDASRPFLTKVHTLQTTSTLHKTVIKPYSRHVVPFHSMKQIHAHFAGQSGTKENLMLKANFLLRYGSNPVRVAAFCFKNLRKTQVLDTDISSAVGWSSLSLISFFTWPFEEMANVFCFTSKKIQNFGWFVSFFISRHEILVSLLLLLLCFLFHVWLWGAGGCKFLFLFMLFCTCE